MKINLQTHYVVIDDQVSRKIEGELVIVPLSTGIGDLEGEMFSLNETGAMVWEKLDGSKTLEEIIEEIADRFNASHDIIQEDVVALVKQLFQKKLVRILH